MYDRENNFVHQKLKGRENNKRKVFYDILPISSASDYSKNKNKEKQEKEGKLQNWPEKFYPSHSDE